MLRWTATTCATPAGDAATKEKMTYDEKVRLLRPNVFKRQILDDGNHNTDNKKHVLASAHLEGSCSKRFGWENLVQSVNISLRKAGMPSSP